MTNRPHPHLYLIKILRTLMSYFSVVTLLVPLLTPVWVVIRKFIEEPELKSCFKMSFNLYVKYMSLYTSCTF